MGYFGVSARLIAWCVGIGLQVIGVVCPGGQMAMFQLQTLSLDKLISFALGCLEAYGLCLSMPVVPITGALCLASGMLTPVLQSEGLMP